MLASTSRLPLATSRTLLQRQSTPFAPRFASTSGPSQTLQGAAAAPRRWYQRKPKPAGWQPMYKRHPILFTSIAVPSVIVASLGVSLLLLLGYDASTYSDRPLDKVAVSPLALDPERGGKKNLKVAEVLVDDEDQQCVASFDKLRLVVVGEGSGHSVSTLVGTLERLDPAR